jgi:NAD(P)H-flavin reductase
MFILMMINPLKKQNKFYFYIINYTYDGCFGREKFFKIKKNYELFMVNNNSREVKWFGESKYRKKLLDEIDLDDISDDFVSQNVRRYF